MDSVARHPNSSISAPAARGGRPRFALSDDQARKQAAAVNEAMVQYPFDPGNHRPFVRAFCGPYMMPPAKPTVR
jgi:hypothetical protein